MSDPALSRPPFIPEGTFRCCLCFDVFPIEEAWHDRFGRPWDNCKPCEAADGGCAVLAENDPPGGHR